ncbi:MAG: FAD-dependent oxidoreductase [Leucobacter sp.]
MPGTHPPKIAIVGSGPSGCYLAQSVLRGAPGAEITIIDRLASPFGLIRYGVAADHQHTKAITRQFDRLFRSGSVRFAGNVEIGRDLSLNELRQLFDAVVLATGLSADRELGVPGAELPGVIGAGVITRTLNAHPDEADELPRLGSDPVIIGGGNVAIDVLRFLVKDRAGFDASDVSDAALDAYLAAPAERVTLVSRSGAAASKGDPQMLRELAALPRAVYFSPDDVSADPASAPDRATAARVAAISEMISADRAAHPGPQVALRFGLSPVRVLGTDRVEGVEFASGDELLVVPATSVITAIGFAPLAAGHLAELLAEHSEIGRIEPGLYRTGWAKRGPRGAIPENRACARSVADEILADLRDGSLTPSPEKPGFEGLPEPVRERAVDYDHWLALETHERENAPKGRVRRKLSDHDLIVSVARGTHD